MTVFQEVLTVNYDIDLDNFLPGFKDKFGDKIHVLKISVSHDFEIDLLKPFQNDKKLKSEIKKFIYSEWIEWKVIFVDNQLPF